ncbi:MAG: heme-binding domain-containing protein [Chloroflexota bacterium]
MRRWVLRGIAIVVAGFLAIQLVPYGRSHDNPPVTAEPQWDSPATRDLAARACFDCHSNATVWPWYTNIAPVSWITQRHVNEGRSKVNFSTWGTGRQEAEHVGRQISSGEMPPWDYLLMHPSAQLTYEEKAQLIQGLQKTLGSGE